MKRVCTILMLIWICNPTWSQQLNLTDQISFASSLAESGNDRRAVKEYLRAYYQDRENQHVALPFTISQLLRTQGDHKNALLFVEKYLYQNNLDEKQYLDGVYEKVTLLMGSGLFKEAQLTLVGLSKSLKDYEPDRYNYFLSMCYVFSGQFDKAKKTLVRLNYIDDPNEVQAVNMLMDRLEDIYQTNHAKARYLSMGIPGLGQAVNGEVKDGLNSFLLLGGLAVLFFEVSSSLNFIDSLVSVGPWFGRYYFGGLQNAVRASQNKMISKQKAEILQLNEYLKRKQTLH